MKPNNHKSNATPKILFFEHPELPEMICIKIPSFCEDWNKQIKRITEVQYHLEYKCWFVKKSPENLYQIKQLFKDSIIKVEEAANAVSDNQMGMLRPNSGL